MTNAVPISTRLDEDRDSVNRELTRLLAPAAAGPCGPVLEAMQYSALGAGQRIRPVLAIRIARLLGRANAATLRAAAAIELLHCASLIVDDLPCMDDELERRGQPATHVLYGEAVAILAAFGLIGLAGRCAIQDCPPAQLPRLVRFQEHLLAALDCDGLIAGQAMDLGVAGSHGWNEIAQRKTVPLFELAARAGTMFADPECEAPMLDLCRAYGSAFQAVDDYLDGEPVSRGWARNRVDALRRLLYADTPQIAELIDLLEERIA